MVRRIAFGRHRESSGCHKCHHIALKLWRARRRHCDLMLATEGHLWASQARLGLARSQALDPTFLAVLHRDGALSHLAGPELGRRAGNVANLQELLNQPRMSKKVLDQRTKQPNARRPKQAGRRTTDSPATGAKKTVIESIASQCRMTTCVEKMPNTYAISLMKRVPRPPS